METFIDIDVLWNNTDPSRDSMHNRPTWLILRQRSFELNPSPAPHEMRSILERLCDVCLFFRTSWSCCTQPDQMFLLKGEVQPSLPSSFFFFFVHSVVYSTARVWYLKEERRSSQIYFRGRPEKKELQCSRWEVTKLSTIIATVCEMREGWRRWSCWKSADQIMLLMWYWKEKVFSRIRRITLSLREGKPQRFVRE